MAIKTKHNKTIFSVGDTISVKHSFDVGNKKQSQTFTGLVIGIKGREDNKSFTVRKIAQSGIAVEKIWPIISPSIEKIKVIKKGNTRRAKLYYLRDRIGKQALKVKKPRK